MQSAYLSFLHLFESVRSFLDISGNLNELDPAESADAEGGNDAEIGEIQMLELLVNAANCDDG